MTDTLALVAPGTGARSLHALARVSDVRVVVEDPAALPRVKAIVRGRCDVLSDFVPRVRDGYHPAVRSQTAELLRQLPLALGATAWSYGGVSVWDTVAAEFHWQFLDSLFQAVDVAAYLLDGTSPECILISRPSSSVSRALAAVAQTRGISVRFMESSRSLRSRPLSAQVIPYLAHARDCASEVRPPRAVRPRRPAPFLVLNHALRNFQAVEPALENIQQKLSSDSILVVQSGATGEREIKALGFACRRYVSYASWRDGTLALAALSGPIRWLTSGRWKPGMVSAGLAWDGVPLHLLAAHEITYGLPQLISAAAREISTARRMLASERPALVMMTEDRSGLTRGVAFVARAMKVPTLLIRYGLVAPHSAWLTKVAADVVATAGEAAAEVVRASEDGRQVRVVVTGQAGYDRLREEGTRASRSSICERFRLDPARPIVLFAAHPIREASATMKRNFTEEAKLFKEAAAVVRAAQAIPGIQLVVKPHPNEGTDSYQAMVDECRGADTRLVSKTDSPYPFLYVCDLVVTHQSTVGLEGLLLGKPLVIVNLCGTPDALPYVESGAAIGAYCATDVEPAIRAALFDAATQTRMAEHRPGFLRRYAASGDVSATERVAELALSIAVVAPYRQTSCRAWGCKDSSR